MAAPQQEFEGMTDEDRRHLDFMQLLIRISDALSKKETADVKLYCMYLIPKARIEKLKRPVEVFVKLKELGKIDQENLDFVEELLERMGRQDLIQEILRPARQPDREVPENPELQPSGREVPENPEDQPENPEPQPGTSQEGARAEEPATSNIYTVVHGHSSMTQETVDRHRQNIASACNTRRSHVKFRGYKKHKSILVHFSIPRENTAVLRHMADHSDPRLVFMGVKSLQIDAEVPIKVQQGALLYDVKRQLPVDDIEVGCSTRTKHQKAPQSWTRLSALNLFSDALPLHLQAAASLEYQGFSYSLVRALVQKDRLREHQMRQAIQNLRNAEVDSNTLRQKAEVDSNTLHQKAEMDSNTLRQKADVDSNTVMTLRSKLDITENRLKEALETIAVLEEKLQQAQEYTEKAVKQVASHVTEYRGEKPPGGWPQGFSGDKLTTPFQTTLLHLCSDLVNMPKTKPSKKSQSAASGCSINVTIDGPSHRLSARARGGPPTLRNPRRDWRFWRGASTAVKTEITPVFRRWMRETVPEQDKLDFAMLDLDGKIEEIAGSALLLAGPLNDFYLTKIGGEVSARLKRNNSTGMASFERDIPPTVFSQLMYLMKRYGGHVDLSQTSKPGMYGNVEVTITSLDVLKKVLSGTRSDGRNYLAKFHFDKERTPDGVRSHYRGKSKVVVSESRPFRFSYNSSRGRLTVSFYRQTWDRNGLVEDTMLQAAL
uniref:DED domain-containing protein n=1 Tax=Branchiostoma floridae TaxID=7739 RepID=C3ZU76_BRAFL|eukprot:XP_002587951.1 hypothetical protein BRAFLDRAFT_124881 [Branchiostoma floridae]